MNIRKILPYIIVCLPFVCFIGGYFVISIIMSPSSIQTPHLIGKTVQEALKITSQNHLNLQLIAEKESASIAPGTILTQKPSSHRLIKQNQSILITIAKEPTYVQTPSYMGQAIQSIVPNAKDLKIKTKQYKLPYQAPSGTCIAQSPHAQTPLPDKKMMLYVATSEPNLYIMPKFIGQNLQDVQKALQNHRIQPSILYQNNNQSGSIVAQKPYPGTIVTLDKNMLIQLEVA